MTKHIIIAGFEKVFPSVGIDTDADVDVNETVQSISAKIAPFLRDMMDSGEYDECDYGMVIDVFQLLPKDYTYFKPEEENRKNCKEIVEISKYYKEQCEQYSLPYYETARDREKVLTDFIKLLEDE